MGKIQFCRICRTEKNLKFTIKQLREFNKKQLLSAQEIQGSATDKASQKLLRTTPTLGNICKDCDDRIQIFHRLDDGNQSSDSDIEIDVDDTVNVPLPPANILPTLNTTGGRPETPVIVDDDDMLYNLFMQKVDQQRQQRHLPPPITQLPQNETQQPQQFLSHFNPLYTPPQSNVGSEGDDTKIIEVLTSRESTPVSIDRNATPQPIPGPAQAPDIVDHNGHRIVAIIDLDDGDEASVSSDKDKDVSGKSLTQINANVNQVETSNNLLNFIVASAKYTTEQIDSLKTTSSPSKTFEYTQNTGAVCPVEDDDDEIVFRRVETPLETTPSKKKKRKSYDEKQLRLVASLSLVSSDSEPDEPATTQPNKEPVVMSPKRFICKQCQTSFPDNESLSVHEQVHQGIKCPVCQFGYSQEQRLIHHMRYKHRSFSGHVLTENPRAPQDSAMTIRLRFMQRKTFYECQLCGRIDDVFKEHKEHIINKHPIESKKLNDPIMKELKCPVCKYKCGTQYLTLCRHIISDHDYGQYKSHLRELVHVSAFGWNASRQQEVGKTARIFQFLKRKTFFFECKTCRKVVVGYQNHIKHITKHTKLALSNNTVEISKSQTATPTQKSPESNIVKKHSKVAQVLNSTKTLKKIKQKLSQKISKSCKKLKSTPIKKNQILKKSLAPAKSATILNSKKSKVSSIKTKEAIEKEPIFKKPKSIAINAKDKNLKPKNTSQKPIEISALSTNKSNKGKRKNTKEDSVTKSKLKKVTIKKKPIKLVELQSYKCKYCPKKFKGFRLYNLHLLNEHRNDEFQNCFKCGKTYSGLTQLQSHIKECSKIFETCGKQSRKYVKHLRADANCNTTYKTIITIVDCTDEEDNSTQESNTKVPESERNENKPQEILPALQNADKTMWLKDLLSLNVLRTSNTSSDNCNNNDNDKDFSLTNTTVANSEIQSSQGVVQCCYCLHLFASNIELQEHDRIEGCKNNEVLIKYTPPLQFKF